MSHPVEHKAIARMFVCRCGRPVFFDSTDCIGCGTALGYEWAVGQLSALEPGSTPELWRIGTSAQDYRRCQNFSPLACNWLVPASDPNAFCRACRLNRTIPNLDSAANRAWWARVEFAKRRLVASLLSLGLPVLSREEDPVQGIAFDFLMPQPGAKTVTTGHENGIITMNLEEADDATRERLRREMGEPYRTLLGHLRHEVGHYYWDRLIDGKPELDEFHRLFGDERVDYQQALARYYTEGPFPNWRDSYVSAYATAHPWEDWAETWAHYLHMRDSIQTSDRFGVAIAAGDLFQRFDEECLAGAPSDAVQSFLGMVNSWAALSTLANELARSMGHVDFYPFVLSIATVQKLFFIHRICR